MSTYFYVIVTADCCIKKLSLLQCKGGSNCWSSLVNCTHDNVIRRMAGASKFWSEVLIMWTKHENNDDITLIMLLPLFNLLSLFAALFS